MKIHFIGIGGIGISGLAQLCHHRGDTVQGSDISDSVIFPILRTKNIPLFPQQGAENITKDLDLVVYTEAIPLDNPELLRAKELDLPCKTYFEYLGEISQDYFTVAVAGTHGKTTTTALIAAGCLASEFEATFLVGSTLDEFGGSNFYPAGLTSGKPVLIVEACEYRENFRFLDPDIVILTSIEWDHPDYFKSRDQYLDAFRNFIKNTKTVIYHHDDFMALEMLEDFDGERIAVPKQSDNSLQFLLKIFGEFNERNALLALTLAAKLDMDIENFKEGVGSYRGAGRRQEFLGEQSGVKFYDDYAHHPTEVSRLLQGFRKKFPKAKIGLVYEPHQFSRTKQFFSEFLTAFEYADEVGLWPIYAARDTDEDKKFKLESFIDHNANLQIVRSVEDIDNFKEKFGKGDVIIFCGAGKISTVAREYLEA